ncbi:phage head closure protein [Jeongeupia sp. USM3]|uniref:phage head closure protein n=1 Tax=Jeongeupia sp. USM3 TaxID=1906741 RepID=UPI00089DFDA0|nr:phage head closure protein [Jeongeupia sp. USM3]AOY00105.1 hypothetical protein BJP62_06355 [Jeongeupia sp. USM3]
MKRPCIGELRHRVTFELRSDKPTGDWGIEHDRAPPMTVWARVEPVGGAIYHGSAQTDNAVTHRILLRYRGDLSADHEATHGGRRYRVRRVNNINGESRFLELEVTELGGAQ